MQAATQLIQSDGALALTLEAVATKAQISKGGLLYHYSTKDALIEGLLEYHLDRFEQAIAETGLPFAQGYVRVGCHDTSGGLIGGLMAAVALNPSLLTQVRQRYAQWMTLVPQSTGALIALMATDGLFLGSLLQLPTNAQLQSQTLMRLEQLAQEDL